MLIAQDAIRNAAIWLQKGDSSKPTLVVLHGLFGMQVGSPYLPYLPDDMPVVALQAPELIEDIAIGSIRERALYYRDILVSLLDGRKPIVHILGLSFGGPLAFELAISLKRSPLNCGSLCLSDPTPFCQSIKSTVSMLAMRARLYDFCFGIVISKQTNFKHGV